MDLSFSEDQELIKSSVEKFITDNYHSQKRRKIISEAKGFNESIWKSFSELGWLGLPFPEELGGHGGGLVDLMILMGLCDFPPFGTPRSRNTNIP